MQVIVKARHMALTPALKEHAEQKLGRALMRILDRPAAKVEIELTELGPQHNGAAHECRVHVFVPKGRPVTITEVADDMYKSIDLAHDRLMHQVKRERGRSRNTHRARLEAVEARDRVLRKTLTTTPEPHENRMFG